MTFQIPATFKQLKDLHEPCMNTRVLYIAPKETAEMVKSGQKNFVTSSYLSRLLKDYQ